MYAPRAGSPLSVRFSLTEAAVMDQFLARENADSEDWLCVKESEVVVPHGVTQHF